MRSSWMWSNSPVSKNTVLNSPFVDRTFPGISGPVFAVTGTDGSRVLIAAQGGHVVSWRTADGTERLFVSSLATNENGQAIRGGIPICFPQFAGIGDLPKHGFARNARWTQLDHDTFGVDVGVNDWKGWPHSCALHLHVGLGPSALTITLRAANTGDQPLTFTGALHTYLHCDDVTTVNVSGLRGARIRNGSAVVGDIGFDDGEVDVDLSILQPQGVAIATGLLGDESKIICAQTGFPDVVVWNIGRIGGQKMTDLGPGEWKRYVCIEAAAADSSITIEPGKNWVGSQTLVVV
jgi:glucose-6-phosphate 1-epimerase